MNDDEEALRGRLHEIVVPPSRVRADDLLPAGRRLAFRRRGTRTAGALVLATGVLLAVPTIVDRVSAAPSGLPAAPAPHSGTPEPVTDPLVTPRPPTAPSPAPTGEPVRTSSAPAKAAVSCDVAVTLPVPSGIRRAEIMGVDPTGRYVIGAGTSGQDFRPVLWTDGVPRKMQLIGDSVQPTDVNSAGLVVGLTSTGVKDTIFRYENGEYTKLRLPAGEWNAYPQPRVNEAGDVLINIKPRNGGGGTEQTRVLLWRAGSLDPVQLPTPKGASGKDLSDKGLVAGGIYKNGVGDTAHVWSQDGGNVTLRAPKDRVALAYAIRGDWVTGGFWAGDGDPTAALWNLRTGTVADLGGASPGTEVNSRGWVITLDGHVRGPGGEAPVLRTAGGRAESDTRAVAISDTGLVVGQSESRLYGWRC